MAMLDLIWHSTSFLAVVWSAVTVLLYLLSKVLYRWRPRWWTTPLAVAPVLLIAITIVTHTSYHDYILGTHWLVALLGPATVAFAVPIYEHRNLVRRHWPVLVAGILVGSTTAIVTAWMLSSALGLGGSLRLSLLPRSVSTPFAMIVSGDIGGTPDLTAVFVVFTGVVGAALGDLMLYFLPLRSALARGALFGMGAHGAGVARAHQIGGEEGAIAGLVMVFVGLLNVLAAPLLSYLLR
jgi:predicted murein hydrolase (TIGR00659 family)